MSVTSKQSITLNRSSVNFSRQKILFQRLASGLGSPAYVSVCETRWRAIANHHIYRNVLIRQLFLICQKNLNKYFHVFTTAISIFNVRKLKYGDTKVAETMLVYLMYTADYK